MHPALYKNLIRPILFRLDAEEAHLLIHRWIGQCRPLWAMAGKALTYKGDDLECALFGHKLSNPIGLAAGFDKNADLVEFIGHLGFGFAEIGSVTALAKEGNPKPRLFRLPADLALINRLGLNGAGADRVCQTLQRSNFSIPIGLNIAKTNDPAITGDAAVADMVYTFAKISDLPLAYVTINGSCPNTKEGIVTEAAHMRTVFEEVQKRNSRQLPILVKLSPDSSQDLVEGMVEAASACGLLGYVCGNTSTSRENLTTDAQTLQAIGNGGLSGAPLRSKALRICQIVYPLKQPSQIIIACGGVASGQDAYDFFAAGASFVQLYTGLVYEGPGLPQLICRQLSQILRQNGQTMQQAIGSKLQSAIK